MPHPTAMAVSGNTIWMLSGSQVVALDTTTQATTAIDAGTTDRFLDGIAVTDSAIWIADFSGKQVIRLDRSGKVAPRFIPVGSAEGVLAVGTTIWVTNHHEGSVSRIDAATDRVIGTVQVGQSGADGPQRLAEGDGSVWVDESNTNEVIRLDPRSGHVIAHIDVTGADDCGGFLVLPTSVWVTSCDEYETGRIDPATNKLDGLVRVDGYAVDSVFANGLVWIPVAGMGLPREIEGIDPASTMVVAKLSVPAIRQIGGAVIDNGALWITDGIGSVFRIPLDALTAGG